MGGESFLGGFEDLKVEKLSEKLIVILIKRERLIKKTKERSKNEKWARERDKNKKSRSKIVAILKAPDLKKPPTIES